jgi:hypothetical protein
MPLKIDKKTSRCCSRNADLIRVEVSWSMKESINCMYNVRISKMKWMKAVWVSQMTLGLRLTWSGEYTRVCIIFGLAPHEENFLERLRERKAWAWRENIIVNVDKLLIPRKMLRTEICVPDHQQKQRWHLKASESPISTRYVRHRDWSVIGASIEAITVSEQLDVRATDTYSARIAGPRENIWPKQRGQRETFASGILRYWSDRCGAKTLCPQTW